MGFKAFSIQSILNLKKLIVFRVWTNTFLLQVLILTELQPLCEFVNQGGSDSSLDL